MSVHSHDNVRPIKLIWLPGIALGALCALLVWPQTHRLVAGQLRFAIPTKQSIASASPLGYTDPAVADYVWPILRRCAAEHPDDLLQQMALATSLPLTDSEQGNHQAWPGGPVKSDRKITRLQGLIPRFADQPSLYATILRFTTQGKVRTTRDEVSLFLPDSHGAAPLHGKATFHSAPGDVEEFDRECIAGERLDPQNAFFPMMRAIGLFETHQDFAAINEIERAAACPGWTEYLDDEFNGQLALQSEAFGEPGPMPRATFAAAILLPHLASIRGAAKVAMYEAMEAEKAGHLSDGLQIRTAVRRVGSLMRSDSRNLIGSLVGISLVKVSMMRLAGSPVGPKTDIFMDKASREVFLHDYDAYLSAAGATDERASVHAEIDACAKTRAITSAGLQKSVFETDAISVFELSLTDMITLSTVVWLAAIGGLICLMAAVAGSKPIKRIPRIGRFSVVSVLTLAAGACLVAVLIQQAEGCVGTFARLSQLLWFTSEDGNPSGHRALQLLCDGYLGIIAVIPVVTLITLGVLCLIWRAPLAAGVARGIRGCIVPLCSVLIIGYAVLAPITAAYERRLDSEFTESFTHEGRTMARLVGAEWPGIVK